MAGLVKKGNGKKDKKPKRRRPGTNGVVLDSTSTATRSRQELHFVGEKYMM